MDYDYYFDMNYCYYYMNYSFKYKMQTVYIHMKTLNISAFFEKTLLTGMAHHPVLCRVIGRKILCR